MVDRQLFFSVHLAAVVMERYFTWTSQTTQHAETQAQDEDESSHVLNLDDIASDPALRKQIHEYAPEIRDQVRRA
jgi:flagellar basal body-associated protein FliL